MASLIRSGTGRAGGGGMVRSWASDVLGFGGNRIWEEERARLPVRSHPDERHTVLSPLLGWVQAPCDIFRLTKFYILFYIIHGL